MPRRPSTPMDAESPRLSTDAMEILSREIDDEGVLRLGLRVPDDLRFFEGHFDDEKLLPAVVELSAMVLPAIETTWPESGPLRALRGLRFERAIRPGDEIMMTVERKGSARFRFVLTQGQERCAIGTIEMGLEADTASEAPGRNANDA